MSDRATRTVRQYQRRDHYAGCRRVDPYAKPGLSRTACVLIGLALGGAILFMIFAQTRPPV